MSGAKHTPVTPFTPGHLYFEDPTWDQKIALRGRKTVYGQPYVVAHVNRPGSARADDDRAYARLFCAAPDLLEALTEMTPRGLNSDNANIPDDLVIPVDMTMGEIRRARAAISRATGEDRSEKGGA